jgi:hypothetical protein
VYKYFHPKDWWNVFLEKVVRIKNDFSHFHFSWWYIIITEVKGNSTVKYWRLLRYSQYCVTNDLDLIWSLITYKNVFFVLCSNNTAYVLKYICFNTSIYSLYMRGFRARRDDKWPLFVLESYSALCVLLKNVQHSWYFEVKLNVTREYSLLWLKYSITYFFDNRYTWYMISILY